MSRKKKGSSPCVELEVTLDLRRHRGGGPVDTAQTVPPPTREKIPRTTSLMALAVRYQEMVDRGDLRDYADIARLGYVSRARMTQIMNLSNLAPDIQEQLLFPVGFLPPERRLRKVAAQIEWDDQRHAWNDLVSAG